MYSEHFSKILGEMVELMVYSEGSITHSDIENMSLDELHYFIYNFKKVFENKQQQRQELIKSIMNFANNVLKSLGDALGSLFKIRK